MFELLVVMGLIVVISAIAIPVMSSSTARNKVWTASEGIGSQIRQARLKAISRNMSFRVRFDCPAVGQYRVLQVTGVAATDNAVNRCSTNQLYDSGVYVMPAMVTYGSAPPVLTVNSRGVYSSTIGIPTDIVVTYQGPGSSSRTLRMSGTGQITFGAY